MEAERPGKFYHITKECIAQMRRLPGLTRGTPSEAKARGIALCPDCERRLR